MALSTPLSCLVEIETTKENDMLVFLHALRVFRGESFRPKPRDQTYSFTVSKCFPFDEVEASIEPMFRTGSLPRKVGMGTGLGKTLIGGYKDESKASREGSLSNNSV